MDHGQVSVERQESQEEDGTVKTQTICADHQLTQSFSEDPLVRVVDGLERQREREDDVGRHQVDEEYIGDRVQLLKLVYDEQNDSVSQNAEDEDDVVERWKKVSGEVVDVDGAAHVSSVRCQALVVVVYCFGGRLHRRGYKLHLQD